MALTYINLYYTYKDAFKELGDAEVGRLIKGALDYAELKQEPVFKGNERFIWAMIKGQIDRDQNKYAAKCKTNSENVSKRYQSTNEYDGIRSYTNATKEKKKEKEKEKENIYVSPLNPPKGRFTPPTVEEVRTYCEERNNAVDADRFVDFYSAKGWMVGKNKMKDWKAAVRTWEKDSSKSAWEKELEEWVNGEK